MPIAAKEGPTRTWSMPHDVRDRDAEHRCPGGCRPGRLPPLVGELGGRAVARVGQRPHRRVVGGGVEVADDEVRLLVGHGRPDHVVVAAPLGEVCGRVRVDREDRVLPHRHPPRVPGGAEADGPAEPDVGEDHRPLHARVGPARPVAEQAVQPGPLHPGERGGGHLGRDQDVDVLLARRPHHVQPVGLAGVQVGHHHPQRLGTRPRRRVRPPGPSARTTRGGGRARQRRPRPRGRWPSSARRRTGSARRPGRRRTPRSRRA